MRNNVLRTRENSNTNTTLGTNNTDVCVYVCMYLSCVTFNANVHLTDENESENACWNSLRQVRQVESSRVKLSQAKSVLLLTQSSNRKYMSVRVIYRLIM